VTSGQDDGSRAAAVRCLRTSGNVVIPKGSRDEAGTSYDEVLNVGHNLIGPEGRVRHQSSTDRRRRSGAPASPPPYRQTVVDSTRTSIATAEAAELLDVTTVTVLSYAKRGRLDAARGPRGWSFDEAAVLALRRTLQEERARWISREDASTLSGLTEYRIKQGIASGEIQTRSAPRNQPTVDRESLLRHAQQLASSPPPPPSPSRPKPPDADGDWIDTDEAAALLDLSRQRVGQLAGAERVPATRHGRFWWFRRADIERRIAAARFPRISG